jgi:RES domain-containing protein
VIAWRITKHRYSSRKIVLAGEGAKENGGRWNEPGLPLVYASESSSLALLETLVHMALRRLPKSLVAVRIRIPDDASCETIERKSLPPKWRKPDDPACAAIGSEWIRSKRTLVLRAPSATNPFESNILLNPQHPEIVRCDVEEVETVEFDVRLIAMFSSPEG